MFEDLQALIIHKASRLLAAGIERSIRESIDIELTRLREQNEVIIREFRVIRTALEDIVDVLRRDRERVEQLAAKVERFAPSGANAESPVSVNVPGGNAAKHESIIG